VSRRRLAAALAVALLGAGAGCGVDSDDGPRAIPSEDLQVSQAPGATTTTASDTRDAPIGQPVEVEIYFTQDADGGEERLTSRPRSVSGPATEAGVLDALFLDPPTRQEREDGLVTAIPTTTRQVRPPQREDGGVLRVSLSAGLLDVEGETLKLAFGQIVCSVTALDTVRWVTFEVDGKPVPAIDGSGEQVTGPVGCSDYANLVAD
jgi:spore germination protein GerM